MSPFIGVGMSPATSQLWGLGRVLYLLLCTSSFVFPGQGDVAVIPGELRSLFTSSNYIEQGSPVILPRREQQDSKFQESMALRPTYQGRHNLSQQGRGPWVCFPPRT